MKMSTKYTPSLCCSKDPSRPSLTVAHLDKDRLYATDGRTLLDIPVTPDTADGGCTVAREVLAVASKTAKKEDLERVDIEITNTHSAYAAIDSITVAHPDDLDHASVISMCKAALSTCYKKPRTISLDAKLLANIQKALGAEAVTITIGAPNEPIKVVNACISDVDTAKAMLMPVRP